MLRHRIDRLLDRLRHRLLAWPLAAATTIFGCAAATRGDDLADPLLSGPRSHIQPAGEVAASHALPVSSPSTSLASPFGLVVARVPDLLREHLALGYGKGLVVNEVVAGSSAAAAGLKQHDVLVSIDEQTLIVPEQLVVLLAGEGQATPKSCMLIRNGQRQTIALRASSPSPSPAAAPAAPVTQASADAPPPTKPKRVPTPTASVLAALPDKKKAREIAAASNVKPTSGVIRRTGATGLLQEDWDYSIELSCDDEKLLAVRDTDRRTIFRAVIETPEQRSRIPLAIRERVEHLERLLDRQMQAAAQPKPVAEIGRLDIEPVQIK